MKDDNIPTVDLNQTEKFRNKLEKMYFSLSKITNTFYINLYEKKGDTWDVIIKNPAMIPKGGSGTDLKFVINTDKSKALIVRCTTKKIGTSDDTRVLDFGYVWTMGDAHKLPSLTKKIKNSDPWLLSMEAVKYTFENVQTVNNIYSQNTKDELEARVTNAKELHSLKDDAISKIKKEYSRIFPDRKDPFKTIDVHSTISINDWNIEKGKIGYFHPYNCGDAGIVSSDTVPKFNNITFHTHVFSEHRFSMDFIKQILLHELLHAQLHKSCYDGDTTHGDEFHKMADAVGLEMKYRS
uniref:SprT-like domain-containing protein n=1 Tax=viral metagenome TaxID=1070528 RepID=A0A6C0CLT0_9ZZZZ